MYDFEEICVLFLGFPILMQIIILKQLSSLGTGKGLLKREQGCGVAAELL
jgi:hypothetical protein